MRSARSIRCRTVATSCLPSRLVAPTTSARLILAGARAGGSSQRLGERGELLGLERLGPRLGWACRVAAKAVGGSFALGEPGERERVGERLAPVRERRPRPLASRARSSAGSSRRRNATSAESTFGGGRKTVRETGWKPVRSAASWRRTETAPYAFVPGRGEETVGDLALDHDDQSSRLGSPSRLSTTSGVATLYGRFATSFSGAGRSAERSMRMASPKTSSTLTRSPSRSRRCGSSARSSSTACTRRDALGEVRRSGRRARGRSPARRPAGRARRAARSRRGCSRRRGSAALGRLFGAAASRQREERPRRWRRSARRARRRPRPERRRGPRRVWTTYAGSFGRPRRGCGARYGTVGLGKQALGRDARRPPRGARRPSDT